MEILPAHLKHELNDLKYSRDEKIMKYILCVAEKMEIFNDDGFQPDRMAEVYKHKLSKEEIQTIAERCLKNYQRKDYSKSEELAYYQWTCMLEDERFKLLFKKNTNWVLFFNIINICMK